MGRPTKYTKALAELICTKLSIGHSLEKVCRSKAVTVNPQTVRLWDEEDREGFSANYRRAREAQGEHYAFQVIDTVEKVKKGKLTAEQARVMNDGYKWAAGKLNNKYSDKVIHAGLNDGPIETKMTVEFVNADNKDQ